MCACTFCMWLHCLDILPCPDLRMKTASSSSWGSRHTSFLTRNTCPSGCMDTAKRTVRDDIGSQWPDLARELGFSQSDIDEIKEREHSSIHGQIFEMFHQWERRSDTGQRSVYELLLGLSKAVNSTNDENLRGIRDRVFTHTILGESCRLHA